MCPRCKSTNIVTERSPDGESYCRDCGRKWYNRDSINPLSATADRSQDSVEPILKYFHYEHLSEKLKSVSKPFHDLAHKMIAELPRNAERSAGLRKLLEAKDCAVRCTL